MAFSVRTDMASEAHRLWRGSAKQTSALSGVVAREELCQGFPLISVDIISEAGAAALQKPLGHYRTLELPCFPSRGHEDFSSCAQVLSTLLRPFMQNASSFLVAALGNPSITPDALGPLSARHILITRHLKQSGHAAFSAFASVSLCQPGVLGTSGVESALHIQALCQSLHPDLVLAVDALAGADPERLCRSIQVCDSGIAPGSGIGNDRAALNRETLGTSVVSIGVPTVIDAGRFSKDEALSGLFVTPRGIDEEVSNAARLIAYAINLSVHPGITLEDIDLLLG